MPSNAKRDSDKNQKIIACRAARAALLVFIVIAVPFAFAEPAGAAGAPTQVIVFTDKKVYKDFYMQHGRQSSNIPAYTALETDNLVIYTYAIVLDDDGNIMKGLSGITGVLDDTRRLDHYHKADGTYHHNTTFNPHFYDNISLIYNDTGTFGDGIAGDGIYTAYADIADADITQANDILDDHLVINISVTYGGLTSYTEVLYSAQACHNGETESHSTHTSVDRAPGSNGPSPCTMCHRGYEHFFENVSSDQNGDPTFPFSKLDVHFQKIQPNYTVQGGSQALTIIWNQSKTGGTAWGSNRAQWETNMPGSSYCYICHYATAGGAVLDYGAGDRTNLNDRPSCSVGSKTLNGVAETISCHATTKIESVPTINWTQPAAAAGAGTSLNETWKAKSHNHTSPPNKANVSCALCHGNIHQFKLPNPQAAGEDYLDIDNQCIPCHNITGGLNITANGGKNVNHSSNDCKACHLDANLKADIHLVPTAESPNANCTECHDLGKKSLNHIDFDTFNKSDYVHNQYNVSEGKYPLNFNASTGSAIRPSENKICWGCHGDDPNNDGMVNFSEQPTNEHPSRYKNARTCEHCHQNASSPWKAPQNVAHSYNNTANVLTFSAPNCYDCHGQPANYNNSQQDPDYNTSREKGLKATLANHYGTGFPALKALRGTEGYCIKYCHQNTSSPFKAEFNNSLNMQRTNHSARTERLENQSCVAKQCHAAEELHGDKMRKPTLASGVFNNTACVESGCHNKSDPPYIDYRFHNAASATGGVNCTSCHMDNKGENIHPIKYLQLDGWDFAQLNTTAASCKLCHKNSEANTVLSRWGVNARKVGSQHHSEDPKNGSKWNKTLSPYWDYIPREITFVTSWANNSDRGFISNFDAMRDANSSAARISENTTTDAYFGSYPTNHGFDSTYNSTGWIASGTGTLAWSSFDGNPPGSITVKSTTRSQVVNASWTASFTYPRSAMVAEAKIRFDSRLLSSRGLNAASQKNINVSINDNSGNITEVYNRSLPNTAEPDWIDSGDIIIPNPDAVFWKNGNYNVTIRTNFAALSSGTINTKVAYDNVFVNISEVDYKKYNFTFYINNTPNSDNQYNLIIGYQTHTEPARLYVLNGSSFDYKTDLDSGAFTKVIIPLNKQEYNNGNVTLRINDSNGQGETPQDVDVHPDYIDIEYMFIESYQWINNTRLHYPCEYCHAPNKHFEHALGVPYEFKGDNMVGQEVNATTNWCASCHYRGYSSGGKNYLDMVQAFLNHLLPVPPEITGHSQYGVNETQSPDYYEHSGLTDFSDSSCWNCHKGKLAEDSNSTVFMHNASEGTAGGSPDCKNCHDTGVSGTSPKVNFSVMNTTGAIHKNLNNGAASTANAENKKCWACHGSGTEDTGHHTVLYSCPDCHNTAYNLTGTNTSRISALTSRKVAEHIQTGYENISSTRTNPLVNCTYCHNKSLLDFQDTASINVNSNVSHYASKTSLVAPTANCGMCHKNPVNASKYQANITRHPARTQDISYCSYCHNTTNTSSLHSQSIDYRLIDSSIHGGPNGSLNNWGFDWEEDDWKEPNGIARGSEGCSACHKTGAPPRICENCHLPDGSSLFMGPRRDTGLSLNASINDSIPRVYSHTNYSPVNVPNQSQGKKPSGCYGFGNMTCHGVDYFNGSKAGGYFAYNYLYSGKASKSAPFHYTNTIDHLPRTSQCMFCHNQSNATIRAAWGNPVQVNASNMYGATTNESCYNCHTTDKSAPKDFHASTLIPSAKGNPNCVGCHNISGNYSNVDFQAVNSSIHGSMNSQATSTAGNATNKPCWGCHGTKNGTYANESDQPLNDHNVTYQKNPRKCPDCHITGNLQFTTKSVTDHIPSGYTNNTDVNTSSYNYTSCAYCHNNSVNNNLDTDGMGMTIGGNLMNASVSHYGANKASNKLMNQGVNSTGCIYCHRNNSNMLTWGILPGSPANISNKNGTAGTGTDHTTYTTSDKCSLCHGGYTITAGFTFHNTALGPGLSGGRNCSACHNISSPGTISKVDFEAINNSVHGGLNNQSVSSAGNAGNKPCWGCHGTKNGTTANETDQNENSHDASYYKNPRKCEDCHINGSIQFGAPGLTEHIMPGKNASTEINITEGYCSTCHNNSITPNGDNDGMGILSVINASTAHYAKDANNNLMSTVQHSDNCTYCHFVNNGSTEWLTPGKPLTSTHSGFSNSTPPSTCWGCHVDSKAEPSTFHMQEINKGTGSGPDCRGCHNISDTSNSRGHIDGNVFNNSIHGNMNTTAGVNPNEPCWGCHGSGESEGHNATGDAYGKGMYKNPYNCTDCHISSGIRYTWAIARDALAANEHYASGADIKASYNSTVTFSCLKCHQDIGEMLLPNSDNDTNMSTGWTGGDNYGITIGGNNSPYHYGSKRSDMRNGINSTCTYCHQNSSTAFASVMQNPQVNRSIFEHTDSGTKNITGRACTDALCHNGGFIHNSTLSKPAVSNWTQGNYDYCAPCHSENGISTKKIRGHNTTNITVLVLDCGYCHNASSQGISGSPLRIHSTSLTNRSAANSTCVDCHRDIKYVPASRTIRTHYPGAIQDKGDTSESARTCELCHGGVGQNKLHEVIIKKPDYDCQSCHLNGSKSSPFNATTGKASINLFQHDNSTHAPTNQTNCERCHNNTNRPEPFHFTNWANGTSQAPGWAGWANGTQANCIDCHRNKTNQPPFYAEPGRIGHDTYTLNQCYDCHSGVPTYASNPRAMHWVDQSPANANCTLCHDVGGEANKEVDVGAMNKSDSIHLNLNKNAAVVKALQPYANESKRCWACHGNGTEPKSHPYNYKNAFKCTDCHVPSGGRNTNYTPNNTILNVTEHYRGGSDIKTEAVAYCTGCHNKTEMLKTNNDTVLSTTNPANDSVSHYGKKRTDIRAGASTNCTYCHQNSSTAFENAMLSSFNKSIYEHTENGTRNTTAKSCTNSLCHASGLIHDSSLTKPAVQVFTPGQKDYCAPCHKAGDTNATKYVYAHNTSNISAVTMDCGYCHNASSQGKTGTGALRIHSSLLTNTSATNSTCAACHRDSKYVGASRVINTHYPGASAGKANTSLSAWDCEECHGWSTGTKMHSSGLIKKPNYDCNSCHNVSGASQYKANATPFVNVTRHDNASHNGANINCNSCHNNTNRLEPFHFTQWSNGTVEAPGWGGWVNGTRTNCTVCHITYANQAPFYAELGSYPNWHKGNYGSSLNDCYQCHSNLTVLDASDNRAPVEIHNVTRTINWGNCNACHASKYGGAPKVDNASLSADNAMHAGIDGATASNINPACKACHGGNASIHKNSSANSCTYCHVTGKTKYGAKNVSEHILNGSYANTTVNTSRYQQVFCDLCHNNSIAGFSDDTQGGSNATTAHYGQNRTASRLMSASANSTDCVYCHKNGSNMAAWGVLSTSKANINNRGDHNAYSANNQCYECHVDSKGIPATFHVEDLNQGTGSNPNCINCHSIGSGNKNIDFTVTNASNNIHKNLNSGANAGGYDSANKPCWACHGNGTATAHINTTYKAPRICESCHINASAPYGAPQVKEHFRNGSEIKATSATNNTRSCLTCHQNISEMLLLNNDPDAGSFDAEGDGINGTNISAYHYGKKRTDLRSGANTSCLYCHQNLSTAFPLTDSNRSIYEHTNTGARNTTGVNCTGGNCHASGLIHDSNLTKPVVQVWTPGSKDYCAPCHMPGNSNAARYVYSHNTTATLIGDDCGYCHNSSSQGINGSIVKLHSPALTNSTSPAIYSGCQGCHNATTIYVGASGQIVSHMPNASQYRGNTSTSSYDCNSCHNMSGKPSMHSMGMNRSNGTCDTCHFNRTSPYKSTKKVIASNDYNHSYSGVKTCSITQCHNASGASKGFHFDKYAAGIIADPERVNSVWSDRNDTGNGFTDTPYVDCIDCHRQHNNTYPFTNSVNYEAGITGENKKIHTSADSIDSCYNCHTNRTGSHDRYMVHNVTIEPLEGGPACVRCHNVSAPTTSGFPSNKTRINHTIFNQSVHRNLTNFTAWNTTRNLNTVLLDSACWACHATDITNIPSNAHPDRGGPSSQHAYQCNECHTTGGNISYFNPQVYENATKIFKHYAGLTFSNNLVFNSSKECFECHRNSLTPFKNITYVENYKYKDDANVSHYGDRSGLPVTSETKFGCNICHSGGPMWKYYGNARVMPSNHSRMGGSPVACQFSCHNSDPGVNITLHDTNVGIYLGTTGCFSSAPCHVQPSTGNRRKR